MRKIFSFLFLVTVLACTSSDKVEKQQHVAICSMGSGCQFSELLMDAEEVDRILGKTNFWTNAPDGATLILENCQVSMEEDRSLQDIHEQFGGKGDAEVGAPEDLARHFSMLGCFNCPNETKKLNFSAKGEDFNGSAYFYINFKAGEVYMPNAAFQQLYEGTEGISQMVVDQFMRNNKLEQYIISEGKKWLHDLPISTNVSAISSDGASEERFKNTFKKTGKKRAFGSSGLQEEEYTGLDDEGMKMSIWLVPSRDVCLPQGKFDAVGFFSLGYVQISNLTYLITEISGEGYEARVTSSEDGSYSFDPTGYQRIGT